MLYPRDGLLSGVCRQENEWASKVRLEGVNQVVRNRYVLFLFSAKEDNFLCCEV